MAPPGLTRPDRLLIKRKGDAVQRRGCFFRHLRLADGPAVSDRGRPARLRRAAQQRTLSDLRSPGPRCRAPIKIGKFRPWIGIRADNAFNHFLPQDVQANISSPDFGRLYNTEYRQFKVQFTDRTVGASLLLLLLHLLQRIRFNGRGIGFA